MTEDVRLVVEEICRLTVMVMWSEMSGMGAETKKPPVSPTAKEVGLETVDGTVALANTLLVKLVFHDVK